MSQTLKTPVDSDLFDKVRNERADMSDIKQTGV